MELHGYDARWKWDISQSISDGFECQTICYTFDDCVRIGVVWSRMEHDNPILLHPLGIAAAVAARSQPLGWLVDEINNRLWRPDWTMDEQPIVDGIVIDLAEQIYVAAFTNSTIETDLSFIEGTIEGAQQLGVSQHSYATFATAGAAPFTMTIPQWQATVSPV